MKTNSKRGTWIVFFLIAIIIPVFDQIAYAQMIFSSNITIPIILLIINGLLLGCYYTLVIKDMTKYIIKMLIFSILYIICRILYVLMTHGSISVTTLIVAFIPLISFVVAKVIFIKMRKDFIIPIVLALGLIVMAGIQYPSEIYLYYISSIVAIATECISYTYLSIKARK